MESIAKWLLKRGANWWLANRPFSKEKRAFRQERRRVRKENRKRKKQGLDLLPEPTKPEVSDMLALLQNLRTSTKSGAAGLLVYVITTFVPDQWLVAVEQLVSDAANADGGAVQFLVTTLVMFAAARLSKTPTNPGKL